MRVSQDQILLHACGASVLFCPVLPCPVLSCPVLYCLVLSCPVLSCPVLSCPVLSWLYYTQKKKLLDLLLCNFLHRVATTSRSSSLLFKALVSKHPQCIFFLPVKDRVSYKSETWVHETKLLIITLQTLICLRDINYSYKAAMCS